MNREIDFWMIFNFAYFPYKYLPSRENGRETSCLLGTVIKIPLNLEVYEKCVTLCDLFMLILKPWAYRFSAFNQLNNSDDKAGQKIS